jgi:hypothetical protein
VPERVIVELPLCARVRDVHEPGKTSREADIDDYTSREVRRTLRTWGCLLSIRCDGGLVVSTCYIPAV